MILFSRYPLHILIFTKNPAGFPKGVYHNIWQGWPTQGTLNVPQLTCIIWYIKVTECNHQQCRIFPDHNIMGSILVWAGIVYSHKIPSFEKLHYGGLIVFFHVRYRCRRVRFYNLLCIVTWPPVQSILFICIGHKLSVHDTIHIVPVITKTCIWLQWLTVRLPLFDYT